MGKLQVSVVGGLEKLTQELDLLLPAAMAAGLHLDSVQSGAVSGGLRAALVGLERAISGLRGKYVAPKRKSTEAGS